MNLKRFAMEVLQLAVFNPSDILLSSLIFSTWLNVNYKSKNPKIFRILKFFDQCLEKNFKFEICSFLKLLLACIFIFLPI